MAAYAALVSLMNNIEQMMSHPRLSTSLHNKHTDSLQEKAVFLLDFIQGDTYGGATNKQVQDLERRIASAAHAAEFVIETHIVDQILAPSVDDGDGETSSTFLLNLYKRIRGMKKKEKKMIPDVKRRISSQANEPQDPHHAGSSLDLQQIIEDMDAILERANELKEIINASKEEQPTHSRALHVESGEIAMVGFADELINQRSNRHIISIVGMGGMGKTTLAQNIYQNSLIVQHFDIRAWVAVSHQYNIEEILSHLLSGLHKSSSRSIDDLGLELHKTLSGRRYLIVLDDIWSVEAWDVLRHFFPNNGNRSRVVLTTRLSNVARDCHSNSCLTLKPLDEHNSWKLFCKKAFQQENCPYPQLERVGKEIARLCKGLPLSKFVRIHTCIAKVDLFEFIDC